MKKSELKTVASRAGWKAPRTLQLAFALKLFGLYNGVGRLLYFIYTIYGILQLRVAQRSQTKQNTKKPTSVYEHPELPSSTPVHSYRVLTL